MKTCNPIDQSVLNIKRKDYVLEVGSGHNPSFRANVLVEKYIESNYHRGGNVKMFPHQQFVNASGECMPFKDNEFDYVICSHVLEHVDDPVSFVLELQRVAKKGYIETPSFIGESLFPKESHRWVCLEIDSKIVLYEKSKLPLFYPDLGNTFLSYLPYSRVALRLFYLTNHQAHTMRYEWIDEIDVIVNPEDEYFSRFFTGPWTNEMINMIFPRRSKREDLNVTFRALIHIVAESIRNKIIRRVPIDIDYYLKGNRINSLF